MKSLYQPACSGCRSNSTDKCLGFSYKTFVVDKQMAFGPSDVSHILFVLSGRIIVKVDDMDCYHCYADQMALLVNSSYYQVIAVEQTDVMILKYTTTIQVCDRMSLNLPSLVNYKGDYFFHSLEVRRPLKNFLASIVYYFHSSIQCAHLHRAKGVELFILFRHYYTQEELYRFFRSSLQKNISFYTLVMNNYLQVRNVKELAERCGYSLSNFKKLFEKNFKESPFNWMRRQMSNRIQVLLKEGDIPIKSIADQFHFTDQSHFNIYCKRHFGATAAQIRKMIGG